MQAQVYKYGVIEPGKPPWRPPRFSLIKYGSIEPFEPPVLRPVSGKKLEEVLSDYLSFLCKVEMLKGAVADDFTSEMQDCLRLLKARLDALIDPK